jgi:hypothetical protein
MVICNDCGDDVLDPEKKWCNHCYKVQTNADDSKSEDSESKDAPINGGAIIEHADKMYEIYMNTKLGESERRLRIYNLCILAWQEQLSSQVLNTRSEPPRDQIYIDGHMSPERNKDEKVVF